MKKFINLLIIFFCGISFSQTADTLKTYWLNAFEVTAFRSTMGNKIYPAGKGDLNKLINNNGFTFIRKGVFFAQDIYSDGLKRSDITVLVDGERYHSACPNRMDSPLTRVNPLDLHEIDLTKTSFNIQSGIGGMVNFRRSYPDETVKMVSQVSGTAGAFESVDAAFAISGYNHSVDVRYAEGKTYKNGDGKKFDELYNYETLEPFMLGEISFKGCKKDLKYGLSFSYNEDISFPYLMMDERVNRVYSGFAEYKHNKIYFNYTDHMMDNGLRTGSMYMKSIAKNLTIGFIRDNFEVYYRNWDIDNFLKSTSMTINNHMIPDVHQVSASYFDKWETGKIKISAKAGVVYQNAGDRKRLDVFKVLYDKPNENRYFPVGAVSVNFVDVKGKARYGLLWEAQTEAPEIESRLISVNKMMMKADWLGNPDLDQVIKMTVRGLFSYNKISIEPFYHNLWNYANLKGLKIGMKPYQTYENIDAYILGVNLSAKYEHLEITASYNYGENKTNEEPLSEIAPFKVRTVITSPEYYGFSGYMIHTYHSQQTRVSALLNENSTGAWNKIDLGVTKKINRLSLSLDVENLLDLNYYQHLSFLRNPFSSGSKVYEPGRKINFSIRVENLF